MDNFNKIDFQHFYDGTKFIENYRYKRYAQFSTCRRISFDYEPKNLYIFYCYLIFKFYNSCQQ